MAHDILYLNPQGDSWAYTFDFALDLPGDTVLKDIGSGSTITAFSSDGTDVSSTILSSKTRTGMTLIVTIGSLTEGEEYRIEFLAQGNTTSVKLIKVLQVLSRKFVTGAF